MSRISNLEGEYPNISNSGVRHVTRRGRWVHICPCLSLALSSLHTVYSKQCTVSSAECLVQTAQ